MDENHSRIWSGNEDGCNLQQTWMPVWQSIRRLPEEFVTNVRQGNLIKKGAEFVLPFL